MERDNFDFLKEMFPFGIPSGVGLVIVNQTSKSKLETDLPYIEVLNAFEKGLPKSRNMALYNAVADFCLFTDDDVIFKKGFENNVYSAFQKFPESAIIRFQYESEEDKLAKSYPKQPIQDLGIMEMMNISTIEMAVNRSKIVSAGLMFEKWFGLGSGVFEMGEEQVFAASIKQHGMSISFVPVTICQHPHPSSNEKLDVRQRYFVTGGVAQAIFQKKANLWIGIKLAFDLKQAKLRLKHIRQALQQAKKGRKKYQNLKKNVKNF